MNKSAVMVKVDIQETAGMFYASSADVQGLHVCGETAEQACESTVKAIKFLFKHNHGLDVSVVPLRRGESEMMAPPPAVCDRFVALAA